jgi:hypothetical protein
MSKNIKNIKIIGLLYSSKFNMCTSLIEILHFLFVIVILPFIFVDDAIIYLANCGRLHTSESEHMYFSLWIYVLLALIISYFPRDDFIMFLAYLCGICTSKIEHLYFPSSLCVLPKLKICTYFPPYDIIIFLALDVKVNFWKFYICTSRHHCV